ncbi:hypothetical protein LSH36_95g05028 [Paralvinella palmiformis]|uniref:Palmitoyltransferase n=1 Tax=Paralvinella palmiformis TaxID=53620 RepID=A0AAD9K0D3_9ANNE|nr:hypothetical protein LSH36_95g05028 [Paralvinella palmiformis]
MDIEKPRRYTQIYIHDEPEWKASAFKKTSPRKGLWEKLTGAYRESYYDPISSGYSHLLSMAYFWFMSISGLYLMLNYTIPERYSDWDPMSRYYLKVAACFIFCQISTNFFCVRFYDSFLKKSKDRPNQIDRSNKINNSSLRLMNNKREANDATFGDSPKFCDVCDLTMPYRTHHCRICKQCVLKRDHHCFFTGICIGYFNQRYFVVMNFYIALSCGWGISELVHFLVNKFEPRDNWDYFLPLTCYRWLLGSVSFRDMLTMLHVYGQWWIGFMAFSMLAWNIFVIFLGKTSHEIQHGVNVRSSVSVSGRLRSVFSDFWLLNFLFPTVIIFKQENDGTCWPDLKLNYITTTHVVQSSA